MKTLDACEALQDWPLEKTGHGSLLYDGKYCALGWLGHKAGISDRKLADGAGDYRGTNIYTYIARRYGQKSSTHIYGINDEIITDNEPTASQQQEVISRICELVHDNQD